MNTTNIIMYVLLSIVTIYMLYYTIKNPSGGTIIATTVLLLLTVYVIVGGIRADAEQKNKNNNTQKWPPDQYMLLTGAQCPDYWVYRDNPSDKTGNTHICENIYNVPVNPDVVDFPCYDDAPNRRKIFSSLKTWPVPADELQSRCQFIKKCGPKGGVPASWIGVDINCQ